MPLFCGRLVHNGMFSAVFNMLLVLKPRFLEMRTYQMRRFQRTKRGLEKLGMKTPTLVRNKLARP
ncbi:hypothetical protein BH160DRAFT_1314 [Burkholderia sp. H160]|nr:hypothetical protein BH160DRAFT_1314 [Burkholderia sp. H160]